MFDALKKHTGQKLIYVVDVYLDQNDTSINFADLEPSSYNTPKTTQDSRAYNPNQDLKLYRLSNVPLGPAAGQHFPILQNVSTTAPVINESIGLRASANITLGDIITNDVYELPSNYANRRVIGSFINKWLARNYLHNRPIILRRGFDPDNFNLDNFVSESYIIESVNGPDVSGVTSLNAVDPLIWASRQKAKVPKKSNGNLSTDITGASVDFTLTDVESADAYPATGYIRFNNEIIEFTRDTVTLPDVTFTINNRAQWGSQQDDHKIGDTGQNCFFGVDKNVTDLILDILENFAGIPADLINIPAFNDAKANELSTHNYTGIVSKPTGAQDVIKDLLETSNTKIFWNVFNNKVDLKSVDEFDNPSYVLDALTDFRPNTVRFKYSEKEQVTRQAINWGRRDATESDDDNYQRGFIFIDDITESAAVYAKENELKEIDADWLPATAAGDSLATGIAQLLVEKRADLPSVITGEVDIKHIGPNDVSLGDYIQIKSLPVFTGPDLTPGSLNVQVTKLSSTNQGSYKIECLALKQPQDGETVDYTVTTNQENLTLTDVAPAIGGRRTVVLIAAGVTIGATNTANAALTTGSYPDGLLIRNRGLILGMGGNGAGVLDNIRTPLAGDGGPALELQAETDIDNGAGGLIWSGGAGGQSSQILGGQIGGQFRLISGSGGGGGQGYGTSLGGSGDPIGAAPPGQDWPGGDGKDGDNTAPGAGGVDLNFSTNPGETGGLYGQSTTGAAAGAAIITNSFVFTITDGNNSFQIKGAIL